MPTALRACSRAWRVWRSDITAARRNNQRQPRLDLCQTRRPRRVPELASIPGGSDMKPETFLRAKIRATLGGAAMAVLLLAAASSARADDAVNILKSMTDYLGSQKTLSASFDSDIEIITPELQKIQFASSGQMKLSRPDKLRARRTGGYADVELVYDGKAISIYGNNAKSYVQAELPGTVDQMIDALQAKSGVGLPGTDLLLSNAFDVMTTTVLDGEHIGLGVVDGVECEHLAFRTADTDWQI